jgi:hypothetical protein
MYNSREERENNKRRIFSKSSPKVFLANSLLPFFVKRVEIVGF